MAEDRPEITFSTNADVQPRMVTYPDFATLFPLTDECDEGCEECVQCEQAYRSYVFSPRNAALMYQTTQFLSGELRKDADDYTQLKELLPKAGRYEKPEFYDSFINVFLSFHYSLSNGEFPVPESIAQQLALHVTLATMREHLARFGNETKDLFEYLELDDLLPTSPKDFDLEALLNSLVEDTDYLRLYDAGIPYGDHHEKRIEYHFADMRVHFWFEPFD